MSDLEKAASNLAVKFVLPVVSDIPGVKQVVGFREEGVKKGSIAALAQSYQGDVKAGSQFSKMQSKAQGGGKQSGNAPQAQGGHRAPTTSQTSKSNNKPKASQSSGGKGKSSKK